MLHDIAYGVLGLCALGAVFALFMLIRTLWTFRARMGVLNDPSLNIYEQLAQYERLPEYDAMMWRLWVWDVRKFIR